MKKNKNKFGQPIYYFTFVFVEIGQPIIGQPILL